MLLHLSPILAFILAVTIVASAIIVAWATIYWAQVFIVMLRGEPSRLQAQAPTRAAPRRRLVFRPT